jgi:phage I-like protein
MHCANTLALCTELGLLAAGEAPGVPGAIPLIPAGPTVRGRDGREWTFDQPSIEAVLQAFETRGVELPIDWEHATQHRAPRGEAAPAAGWITALNVRGGALWADVQWTDRGHDQVLGREYRYISPVFDFDPNTGRIVRLVSAGLTNTPNLHLQALNQEQPMKLSLTAALAAALGVSADADEATALTAIESLKTATNREATNLERYVPRADYDQVLQRATNAEQQLRERDQAAHKAAVDAAIDGALKSGKITPATADYHRASCSDRSGLERFQQFVAAAPVVAPDSSLDTRRPPDTDTALNAEQIADQAQAYVAEQAKVGRRLSISDAVFHVTKGAKKA